MKETGRLRPTLTCKSHHAAGIQPMSRLESVVDAELAPIKLLLDSIPPFLRERAARAATQGDALASNVYRQALGLELESLVLQLNAAVDGFVFVATMSLKGDSVTASHTRRSRSEWLADLQAALSFSAAELSGWEAIEATRAEGNLIKHRLGIAFSVGSETPLAIETVLSLDEALVRERFVGVRRWLVEVARRCEKHRRTAAAT